MISNRAYAAAFFVALLGPPAFADPAPAPQTTPRATPDVATLLFETAQWDKAPIGSGLAYSYVKKTDAIFGPSFEDRIALSLEKGDDAKSRTVDVKMFTGDHVKAAGPFRSTEQNPVLLLSLEANVEDLTRAWHANPRFLKNAVRKAWRDDAKIEKTPIDVGGKSVPGTRITIEPYKDSSEASKMMGLQTMIYVVEIADDVPGQIVTVDVHAPATGTPTFHEVLRFQSEVKP